MSKDTKKEEESTSEADKALVQLESARRSVAEKAALKVEEEARLEEIMGGLQDSTRELRENLEQAQTRLAGAERDIATYQTEKETVSMSLHLLQSRAENAAKALHAAEDKMAKLALDRTAALDRIQAAEAERVQATVKLTELEQFATSCAVEENRYQTG